MLINKLRYNSDSPSVLSSLYKLLTVIDNDKNEVEEVDGSSSIIPKGKTSELLKQSLLYII